MPGEERRSVFERHRGLVLACVALVPVVLLDCAAAGLLLPASSAQFRRSHPFYHHGLIPSRAVRARWGTGSPYPVHTNSLGLIDGEVREVPLQSDRYRVLFLGDSYTEGIGVAWPETFVGRLAARVDPARVELLNAAVISYCPRLHYLKAFYLLEHVGLEVDEIWVFIDISDVQDEVLYQTFEPHLPSLRDRVGGAVERWLGDHSYFYATLSRTLRRSRADARRARYRPGVYPPWLDYFWLDDIDEEAYREPGFVHYRDRWTLSQEIFDRPRVKAGIRMARQHMDRLAALAAERNVVLRIGVYPWPTQIQHGDRESVQVRIWERFAEERDLELIDLFPTLFTDLPIEVFRERYLLPGDVHWNARGHALVADALWPRLEAALRAAGAR